MRLKLSSAKWRPFCTGEDELRDKHKYNNQSLITQVSAIDLLQIMRQNYAIYVESSNSVQGFRGEISKWRFTISPDDFGIFHFHVSNSASFLPSTPVPYLSRAVLTLSITLLLVLCKFVDV